MTDFYDRITPFHHLIFEDWDRSIESQAEQLAGIIRDHWGADTRSILDVSRGIGTQALALALRGYRVTASDLSAPAVEQAPHDVRHADAVLRNRHGSLAVPDGAGGLH